MKKIAFWNNYTSFANNKAFDSSAYGIGEDLGYPIILMKELFEKKGYTVETLDMDDVSNYDAIIFSDVPDPKTCCKNLSLIPKQKKFLILEECEMIYAPNKRTDLLNEYNKVFAYNDNLVDKCGYIKLNMPNKIKIPNYVIPYKEKLFSVMIAGNKRSDEDGELYSERRRAIHYMEKNHPAEFDLYGIGWNRKHFTGNKLLRALNRLDFLCKLLGEKHSCYKGKLEKKLPVLSKYKFCFCYENSSIIPGYISEKIMDCFFAGCVPVYFGAPNIKKYIPSGCFIDFRDYKDYDTLYTYLNNMTENTYNEYIKNILEFLKSDFVYGFTAECFAETIVREVITI